MRDALRAALSGEASPRLAFACLGLVGLALAVPFAACRFLPLVDLPMHQLELAIWLGRSADGHGFAPYYESAPLWLPYWVPLWLGAALEPLVGLEAAGRAVVALYVAALPVLVGLLAYTARRSPWLALLVVPFVLEHNLLFGFVAYCLATALWVAVLATALHIERAPRMGGLITLAGLSLCIGFTHAQLILPAVFGVWGLLVLGDCARRWRMALAVCCALPPLGLWAAHAGGAEYVKTADSLSFMPFSVLLQRMGKFSIDVYPTSTDDVFFASAVGILALSWLAASHRGTWRDHRLALIAGGALLCYFVLPSDWHGQSVCQRMLLPALLLLPALSPPDFQPSRGVQGLLVVFALGGVWQTSSALIGFDRDTRSTLEPLIARAPSEPRLAHLAYDLSSPWVKGPPYAHAGAWVVLVRGGVYAEHFGALTSHYQPSVPVRERLTDVFEAADALRQGMLLKPAEARLPFWNTWLVRWTRGNAPPQPGFLDPGSWSKARAGSYTLYTRSNGP